MGPAAGCPQHPPCDLLLQETLTPIAGSVLYHLVNSTPRTVSTGAMVRYKQSAKSVPTSLVGCQVYIEANATKIVIRARDSDCRRA